MGCAPASCKKIGFGLIAAAAVFFFNPVIAVLDLLPDVIGYLLLCAALTRTADLSTQLAEARRGFWRLALIDALKLASNVWMITMVVEHELPNTRLLLTFVFAVLEFIYAIPAWGSFFDGTYALIIADGDPSRYALPSRRQRRAERTTPEQMKTATVALIIWRNVLAVLPEMSSLAYAAFDNSGYVTNADRNLYDFRGLFLACAVLVMLVIGTVWLVRMLRFACRLAGDRDLSARLTERYRAEVLPCEKLFTRRALQFAFTLLGLSGFLTLDLYVDDLNILPDVLAAAAVVWALLRLRRCPGNWKIPLAASALWGVLSICTSVLAWRFYDAYYLELIYRKPEAYDAYLLLAGSTVLMQIAFFAAMLLLGIYLRRLTLHYVQEDGGWETKEFLDDQRRQLISLAVLALLSAAGGVCYILLQLSVEFIWLIDFALALIFAIYAWKTMSEFSDHLRRTIGEDRLEQNEEKVRSMPH